MGDLGAADLAKFAAARRAVDLVEPGMKLGLGTGSTAAWMVRCLAARARAENLDLTCVATSEATASQARGLGLKVVALDDAGQLDLTIDGADEIDPALNLIKGGGGAHLREKIVAAASRRLVVIADPGKWVPRLGAFDLPIEVVPFGMRSTMAAIARVLAEAAVDGRELALRMAGEAPLRTDEGNVIVDAALGAIHAPRDLAAALNAVPGVVETGLFLGMCDTVVLGHPDGQVDLISASDGVRHTDHVDLGPAQSLPA